MGNGGATWSRSWIKGLPFITCFVAPGVAELGQLPAVDALVVGAGGGGE